MKRFIVIFFVLGIILFSPATTLAYYTNMPASVVIGQTDFLSGSTNQGGGASTNTLFGPTSAIIIAGKLVVSDGANHRVLIYKNIPTTNNVSAETVIGQPDFTSNTKNQCNCTTPAANTLNIPEFVATDGTKLFISDFSNNRVLIYNTLPTTNNASADVVVGQVDFSSGTANQGGSVSASTLATPVGIAIYNGKLIIADRLNNRVLIYNSIPTTNNASANVVIGQPDFVHSDVNMGAGFSNPSANGIQNPFGLSVSNGKLLLSDLNNNRVLIFNSIPTTNGASADVVIGQPNFTSRQANQGGSVAANTINGGQYVEYSNNRLFITDTSNFRLLIYNSIPTANNASADIVLGQVDFVHGSNNGVNASSFQSNFFHVEGNKLILPDSLHARVLIFYNVISTPSINLTTPPTSIGSGRYRLLGNINMNNNGGTYSLQTLQADLNGTGYGNITFAGGRSDGGGNTIYDFIYDFDPSVGGGDINSNLTLKFLASTFNADTNTLFYFLPFKLKSVTKNQIVFNVNKNQLSKIKDNISHFEVWTKTSSSTLWTKYIDNILPSQIDTNGDVYISKLNSLTSTSYKVKAVDNWNNSQESNILSFSNTSVPVTNFVSFTGNSIASPEPSLIPLESSLVPSSEPTPTQTFENTTENSNVNFKPILIAGIGILATVVVFTFLILKRRK